LDVEWYVYRGNNIVEELFGVLKELGYTVIAPVKRGDVHVLAVVKDPSSIDLNFVRTVNSPKHFLYTMEEPLFRWRRTSSGLIFEEIAPATKPCAFLGIKPCDANAISLLDEVLGTWCRDPYYLARRSSSFVIVYDCRHKDQYCFCESVGHRQPAKGSYDLWVVEDGGEVYIGIGTNRGFSVVRKLRVERSARVPVIRRLGTDRIPRNLLEKLGELYEADAWEDLSSRCLLCGGCTSSCPTCTCFDMRDEPEPDLEQGVRFRTWTSCVLRSFTMVAGGRVVRKSREERFKFRYFHKLVFSRTRFGRYLCVGCGRCSAQCPAGIDMVEVVSKVVGSNS